MVSILCLRVLHCRAISQILLIFSRCCFRRLVSRHSSSQPWTTNQQVGFPHPILRCKFSESNCNILRCLILCWNSSYFREAKDPGFNYMPTVPFVFVSNRDEHFNMSRSVVQNYITRVKARITKMEVPNYSAVFFGYCSQSIVNCQRCCSLC
jgi:hypothetical protein